MVLQQFEPKSIKIWSTAVKKVYLWSTQVRPAWWQPWANLLAYYPFDGDINDHKWDLWYSWTTYNCAVRWTLSTGYTTGKVDNCIYRSNTGNGSLNTWITLTNKFSLMMWIYLIENNGRNLFTTTKTSDSWYGFSFQFNNLQPWIKVAGDHYFANTSITTGTWHHYVLTQDGTTAVFYVDWVWKTFTVNGTAWPNTLQILWIFDGWCKHRLDDVFVFGNRVLTQQEITDYLSQFN